MRLTCPRQMYCKVTRIMLTQDLAYFFVAPFRATPIGQTTSHAKLPYLEQRLLVPLVRVTKNGTWRIRRFSEQRIDSVKHLEVMASCNSALKLQQHSRVVAWILQRYYELFSIGRHELFSVSSVLARSRMLLKFLY